MLWVGCRYLKNVTKTQELAHAGNNLSQEVKAKSCTHVLPETSEDDSCKDPSENGEEAANQYKMKKCNPSNPRSDCGNGSATLGASAAQIQALRDAGWERRLAALETLEIESRLKQLESVDVFRSGIQLERDELDNLEPHCKPTQAMAGQDSMPTTVTTDSAAVSSMRREATVSPEIHKLEARVCNLDDAVAELQRGCELQATQLMETLHRELAVVARKPESSKQLRHEVEGLQQQFDAAVHELRVRCQILERQCRGSVHPAFLGPSVVTATSPRGGSISTGCTDTSALSDQQSMHPCLRSSLSPLPTLSSQGSGAQLQVPPKDSIADNTNMVSV